MNSVMTPWAIEIGLITWRTMTGKRITAVTPFVPLPASSNSTSADAVKTTGPKRPPLPSELLASFVAFGVCAIIADTDRGRQAGALLAWGLVVATFLNMAPNLPGANAPTTKGSK